MKPCCAKDHPAGRCAERGTGCFAALLYKNQKEEIAKAATGSYFKVIEESTVSHLFVPENFPIWIVYLRCLCLAASMPIVSCYRFCKMGINRERSPFHRIAIRVLLHYLYLKHQ